MTHWLEVDYRVESLNLIIIGLENSIQTIVKKNKEIDWYDGIWMREESEPIYGLAFIAFQNYINGSINDLFEKPDNKAQYYKLDNKAEDFQRTQIELIIGLANYYKHKDAKFHKGTVEILNSFNLDINSDNVIDNSPIFEGLELLNKKWDLFEIKKIVTDYRNKLLNIDTKKHSI
jgi:hypothetical protein